MKPSRKFVMIIVLALLISTLINPARALAAPSQQGMRSASISFSPFNINPVMVGDAIPFDLAISVANIAPGVGGADIYLSYNPVLVSLSKTNGAPNFFGTANVSINEVLLADKCPGGTSPCVHLVLAGSPQTTKTGVVASFQFNGIAQGTACFSVTGSKMVDADGFDVPFDAAPEQCVTLKPPETLTRAIVLRQGISASQNPSGGSLACTSVTANGTASGIHSANTDQNGEFLMDNLAMATYTVRASYPGYLDSETQNVIVDSSLIMHLETPTLVGGDVNGDGAINILDIGTIISKFGQAGVAVKSASLNCSVGDESADINDDGLVNIGDLAITAGNWGKVGSIGSVTPTPTFTPTFTFTPTPSGSPIITITPTFTFTPTPIFTATPTFTPSPTNTGVVANECTAVTEIPSSECNALVALYNSSNGRGWVNKTGWLVTNTPCTWHGITCSGGHVTELHLDFNHLQGNLPPELGYLIQLKIADFTCNWLNGSIPSEMGNLSMLTELYIGFTLGTNCYQPSSGYVLTGNIPPALGKLGNLKILNLASNQLTGSIPAEIGNLTNLITLDLSWNQLTGSIPVELGNLANLTNLILFDNQLTGNIPVWLGSLTNLTEISLDRNQLTGSIPPQLGNLTKLEILFLAGNQLTGSIPVELGNLMKLTHLNLMDNQLTGSIPMEFGNLTNLLALSLSSNQLIGSIPSQLGNLTKLEFLDLDFTSLSGAMPDSLRNLIGLKSFYFPTTICRPNTPEFLTWFNTINYTPNPYTLCQ